MVRLDPQLIEHHMLLILFSISHSSHPLPPFPPSCDMRQNRYMGGFVAVACCMSQLCEHYKKIYLQQKCRKSYVCEHRLCTGLDILLFISQHEILLVLWSPGLIFTKGLSQGLGLNVQYKCINLKFKPD